MIIVALRRSAAIGALACAAAAAVLTSVGTPAAAADAAVSATSGNTFEPPRVAVNVGDTVTWTSTGGLNHTVTSSSPNWTKDDGLPVPGRSTAYTFEAPGTYTYFCKTHGSPSAGMRGSVSVAAPTRPPPPATVRPSPSRPPTVRPSPTVAPTRPPVVSPSPPARPPRPSPTPSRSAAPMRTTAPPPALGLPSSSPGAIPSQSAVPLPSVADEPSDVPTVDLGSGGLGPRPTTDRGRGLPTFLALVALVGVVSAQVRALLALPVDD